MLACDCRICKLLNENKNSQSKLYFEKDKVMLDGLSMVYLWKLASNYTNIYAGKEDCSKCLWYLYRYLDNQQTHGNMSSQLEHGGRREGRSRCLLRRLTPMFHGSVSSFIASFDLPHKSSSFQHWIDNSVWNCAVLLPNVINIFFVKKTPVPSVSGNLRHAVPSVQTDKRLES